MAIERDGSEVRAHAAAVVVVCDDEERLARLTAGLIQQLGYATRVARSLDAMRSLVGTGEPFDLLLLDVNLNGEHAADVVQLVRGAQPGARVVLTSGYAREDVPAELLAMTGVVAYLAKPYTVDELADAIHGALGAA